MWVLNFGSMQTIQSYFYLLHDEYFEIVSNISGPPTLNSLIEQKKER